MKSRAVLTTGFILAMVILSLSLVWIMIQFALPRTKWIEIGKLSEFPPSDVPYNIKNEVHVFLVNNGSEIIVLDPLNRAPNGFAVNWNSVEMAFIDPQRGSWFNLNGYPYRRGGVNSILEQQSLARYVVKIENGTIFIDRDRSQVIHTAKQP